MADGHDRFDGDDENGGNFLTGLLAGTVLGAGIGTLFAPKNGTDPRHQMGDQASGHLQEVQKAPGGDSGAAAGANSEQSPGAPGATLQKT